MSATSAPAPEARDDEVDLLVAGSGAAGMTAALVAALEGLHVVVCEKSSLVGGTTAISGGATWIPASSQSRRAGLANTLDDVRRYLDDLIGSADPSGRREAFLEAGPLALDYLEARSEVKFAPSPRHPDYYSERPGALLAGRALYPVPFDGRRLGRDFELVRPPMPEYMVLGGMMVGKDDVPHLLHPFASLGSLRHATSRVLRYVIDRARHARGTHLLLGNALVARLLWSLRRQHVAVWVNAAVSGLVSESGCVTGAVVTVDGTPRPVRARRGVVLAGGGFSGSKEWRNVLMPSPVPDHTVAFEGASGDGLTLGRSVGAAIDTAHASAAYWMPASVMSRADGTRAVFPHILLDRAKPGLVAVNRSGRRFVNEADSYHDFVLGMLHSNRTVDSIPAHLVCDRRFLHAYGLGCVRPMARRLGPYIDSGYLVTAPTLRALAARIGVDAAGLEATVARHNRFAAVGVDEDFGKGSTELNRHNGDPDHRPNPCLGPIEEAPFFAMAVFPADLGTSVGLHTDADGRVLDETGAAIPGLYACGNDAASVFRGHYPGPGINIGPAIAFAFRIAMHASGTPVRSPGAPAASAGAGEH
jgi:FAD binding domain-containing protein